MLSFFLISMSSCEKKQEKNLKSVTELTIGTKLMIPSNLTLYNHPSSGYNVDSTEIANSKYKIYSHINVSCSTCLEEISLWADIITSFKSYQVPVILICSSHDNFELIMHLFETNKIKNFSYPIFFDLDDDYIEKNKFMDKENHFKTVLTDSENKILLLGNPIYSKKIKEMYLNELRKRTTRP